VNVRIGDHECENLIIYASFINTDYLPSLLV
jgi:hypothetical protein